MEWGTSISSKVIFRWVKIRLDHNKPVFDLILLKQNPPAPSLPFFMAQFYHLFMAAIKYYSPVIKRFFSWKITNLWLIFPIFPATKLHLEWISMDFQLPCLITGGYKASKLNSALGSSTVLFGHGGDPRNPSDDFQSL